MGSAGHAFLAHTKALSPAASAGSGGWGSPPHPLEVRPGQRYWPRAGRRRRVFVVKRCDGDAIVVQRLDGTEERARVTRRRLLAVRDDGQGLHYAFGGCVPRRYATFAVLVAVAGEEAVLIVPEWHPARPVRLPLRLLPVAEPQLGTWFRVNADLGATSAGRLSPARFAVVPDPGAEHVHRPLWTAPAEPPRSAAPPAVGRGCGDLVVHLAPDAAAEWLRPSPRASRTLVLQAQRPPEVHETGQTPRLDVGARIYLAADRELLGHVTVVAQRRHPGGGDVFTTTTELQPPEPIGPFPRFHNWRWRWWPIPQPEPAPGPGPALADRTSR